MRALVLAALLLAGPAMAQTPQRVGPLQVQNSLSEIAAAGSGAQAAARANIGVSSSSIIPTGATTALALTALAAQQGVLLDAFKVAGDADDTASMTRAVAAGVPILLGPKTYLVHDFNTGAVTNFVLKGVAGSVIQRNAATNPSGTFFSIAASKVVIDGVTFDANSGSITANQWGVRLAASGQIASIRNSAFKNNSGSIGACLTLQGSGLAAGGSFDILNNELTNCTLQALYVNSASNGTISGNWVHDVSGFGIFVGGTTSLPATDINVVGNRVFRSGSTGISIGSIGAPFAFGSPTAIRVSAIDNILQDNPTYGISLEGDWCDAIGNDISQSTSSVSVLGAIDTLERYGKIENNTIVFAGVNYAIDIGGSQGMLVSGNHVTMNHGAAYNTGGNLNTTVIGNIANLTGTAIGVTNYQVEGTGSGGTFPTQSSNTTIEDNTFNMAGSSTVGITILDDAGGAPGASANTIRNNKFNVTGSGITPAQAIQWKGGAHTLFIDGNLYNGANFLFQDAADLIFDWVNLGGTMQGISSTSDIRSIIPRDVNTYGAGGSVLWAMPSAGGANYVQATTTISFSGTGCTGQAGTAQVNNGAIVGVKMTNFGSGCSGAVTASAADSSGGSGATFTVGTVPVMPDRATMKYISAATHTLQKNGGFVTLLPQVPIQLANNNGAVSLSAHYGGAFWDVNSFNLPVFAIGSLPTCGTNNNGAIVNVTGSTSGAWQARCNGTNWIAPSGSTVS